MSRELDKVIKSEQDQSNRLLNKLRDVLIEKANIEETKATNIIKEIKGEHLLSFKQTKNHIDAKLSSLGLVLEIDSETLHELVVEELKGIPLKNITKRINELTQDSETEDIQYTIKESMKFDPITQERLIKLISEKTKLTSTILKKNIPKENKDIDDEKNYTSLIITDEHIVEQVYENNKSRYCIYNKHTKEITYANYFIHDEETHYPISGEEIEKSAIRLPTKAEEYGTDKELDSELKTFIKKWLDIPDDILQLGIWNIKRSWVFDKFHTLNYMRALGDTGQGKTRFLNTLGLLHYKPINTSGATTSAPVFRIIEKWRGTLIMDEADFKLTDETQDIIKIINLGYERGTHIMRCDQNDAAKISFFDPYCPKILATRKAFSDKAVESRCITQIMVGTERKDIPVNLNDEFFNTAQTLRNKLLMWRFRNYDGIDPSKNIDLGLDLEPRVKQISSSLSNLFGDDPEQLEVFKKFIKNKQDELIEERQDSFEGMIVNGFIDLLDEGETDISAKDIIEKANITNKEGTHVKPRSLTTPLKTLGFGKQKQKRVDGVVKRCLSFDDKTVENIRKRYCTDVPVVTVVTETSGTTDFNKKIKDFVPIGSVPHSMGTTGTSVQKIKDKTVETWLDNNPVDNYVEAVEKFGETMITKLLQNGDIIEFKPGILRWL